VETTGGFMRGGLICGEADKVLSAERTACAGCQNQSMYIYVCIAILCNATNVCLCVCVPVSAVQWDVSMSL
jgi:hypothetical protein